MRETSNYKLSQWDKTDRIEMEDFNGDNAKVDAALRSMAEQIGTKASQAELASQAETLRSENMWVKIGETILSAESETASVTVANPSLYRQFHMIYDTGGCKQLYLTVNGEDFGNILDYSFQCELIRGYATYYAGISTGLLLKGTAYEKTGNYTYSNSVDNFSATMTFGSSATFGLRGDGGSLNAGTHIDIYGLKK